MDDHDPQKDGPAEPQKPRAKASTQVAWPGRIVAAVLGPPTSSCAAVNGRLRYRACSKCASSVGMVNVVANLFLMILKGYLGVVGRSTALVADAIHSAADVISAIMLVFGLRVARKPADQHYPYGYGKIEFLVAVVIYSSLILAGVVILADAISSIIHKESVSPHAVTIWGALISVVVNEVMFRQSVCAGTQIRSPSIVANAWEKRSDALSSLAVLVGIVGATLGWHFLDPAAAILVAVFILKFSVEMIHEAFKGLLDTALPPEVVEGIRKWASEVEGVSGIRAVRTREIGQKVWIDLEVEVSGDCAVDEIGQIKRAIRKTVSKGLDRPANVVVYLKSAPA